MIKNIFLNENMIIRILVYLLVGLLLVISPVNIALLIMYILCGMFIGNGISKLLG